jgi:adenylate cyclase
VRTAGFPRLLAGAIVGIAGTAVALALWLPGALESFEVRTWDLRARLLARPGSATGQVVTILLDQESLIWGKKENGLSWPWPRETYTAVADFCRRGGARALIFDVMFTEPSVYGVPDDQAFGAAVAENGRVIAAMQIGSEQAVEERWQQGVPDSGIVIDGLDAWVAKVRPKELALPKAEFPIPELAKGARMLATVNLPFDRVDKVYRRARLFNLFDGRVVPAEALAAFLAGAPGDHALSIRPGLLSVDGLPVPIDSEGRAILRYRGPTQSHKAYGAKVVIQSELQLREGKTPDLYPAVFRDKYVFFGYTALGLYELKPSPMKGAYSGVEINATMLDNLLSGDFMKPAPLAATIAILLFICMGAALSVSAVSRAGRSAVIYVLFIPLAPALGVAAYALGYWLQLVALELGTVFALVGASLVNYATEGRQKRYIKGAFRQYLSPAVIEELIAHPERLKLGGERRELTIYFSDLQGFTTLSEALTPEDLTTLLNEYLSAMTDII